jgi:hypothetical protein
LVGLHGQVGMGVRRLAGVTAKCASNTLPQYRQIPHKFNIGD